MTEYSHGQNPMAFHQLKWSKILHQPMYEQTEIERLLLTDERGALKRIHDSIVTAKDPDDSDTETFIERV